MAGGLTAPLLTHDLLLHRSSLARPAAGGAASALAAPRTHGAVGAAPVRRPALPNQRAPRRALHVANYVAERAPVAYKELSVGELLSCRRGGGRVTRLVAS